MSGTIELVLGGARSGKSDWAAARAAGRGSEVLFIATAEAGDPDMAARIAAHRRDRPAAWRTLEEPCEVTARLRDDTRRYDVIVVDCLTLLVSNWLLVGETEIRSRIVDLCEALRQRAAHAIVVSNEVGSGIVPDNELGRRFRDQLGLANRLVAEQAEEVRLLVAGIALSLKERE